MKQLLFGLIFFGQMAYAQTIKIAVDTTYPPMEFESDEGKIIGLDIDLMNEMAKVLNLKTEFIIMPWDGILAGLKSNRYDIIMSSMNITPERSLEVNFIPYLKMGQVFITSKSSASVKTEKDLENKIVAVQADSTSFTAVNEFQKKGIKIKEIKAFRGATETFSALKSRQADVIVIDQAVGYYYSNLDKKSFIITGEAMKPEPMGIAVKKKDSRLFIDLTRAMDTIKKNGMFTKIYKKWLNSEPILNTAGKI